MYNNDENRIICSTCKWCEVCGRNEHMTADSENCIKFIFKGIEHLEYKGVLRT